MNRNDKPILQGQQQNQNSDFLGVLKHSSLHMISRVWALVATITCPLLSTALFHAWQMYFPPSSSWTFFIEIILSPRFEIWKWSQRKKRQQQELEDFHLIFNKFHSSLFTQRHCHWLHWCKTFTTVHDRNTRIWNSQTLLSIIEALTSHCTQISLTNFYRQ